MLAVLACFCTLYARVAGAAAMWRPEHRQLMARVDSDTDMPPHMEPDAQDLGYCGMIEDNMDFWTNNLYNIDNITSAEGCCAECQQYPMCRAWTWGKVRGVVGLSDVCYLKGLAPGAVMRKVRNRNTTSGTPFRTDEPGRASLFCFSSPSFGTSDCQLLALSRKLQTGIFDCDESAVYRRKPSQHATRCSVVQESSQCSEWEPTGSCVDSEGFLQVWKKVVSDGRFRYHRWTVKVDPDAVFLPKRLRLVLRTFPEPAVGVYFNNCEDGLVSSIEVLSRRALQAYALGYLRCTAGKEQLQIDKPWAEGHFIDQCLSQVLRVQRHTELSLLSDTSCKSSSSGSACSGGQVAFHPFTTTGTYETCILSAPAGAAARL